LARSPQSSVSIKCRSIALAALLLMASAALAQSPQPYLKFIPSGGTPDMAERGTQIVVYGSNFCQTRCSPVTLTVGNDVVAPFVVATAQVSGGGTFAQPITVNVPFAWRYLITATQTTSTGATISASVPITVPQSDFPQTNNNIPNPQARPKDQLADGDKLSHGRLYVSPSNRIRKRLVPDPSGVTEFPPNVAYDGRSVAVDVSAANDAVAIAASESGGLWKTTNTGANWSPLTGLPTFRMSDVKMAPSNDQIVIATAWFDSHVTNGGGVWRSTDGGTTWQKPPTADPPGCPVPFNAWGISFAPGTNYVFVGTDCGISISQDLGDTWKQVSLPAVYGIIAQPGSSGPIVDTCGADGHHRSTNGGATFTASSSALPGCPYIGVHTIAVSPLESNVLFAAIGDTSVYESDNGGVSWSNLNPPTNSGSREPWVATHLSSDGNPSHFDIYFGSGLNVYRQTCTNTGGPGLRCSTSWSSALTIDHSDQNGLAFSTSGNCAQYIVSDGGIHITPDCGATWTIAGNGPGGYHALQIYEMNDQVHPSSTDLYFGTQDNSLWASSNDGSTWINPVCCEGFFLQMLHDSASDAGQTITFTACSGCSNEGSAADFVSVYGWNNPPAGGGNPFLVSQGVYLQWSAPSPPTNQLYFSTTTGGSWSPVAGATTTLQLIDHPFISGPSASPTVYQEVRRTDGTTGLIKITGVLSGSATVTNADTGIGNIGFWSMGQGTFRWAQVFGVDPNNPLHLIVADIGVNQMMVSLDGGGTWNPDLQLTALVTNFGQFQFSQPSTTFPGLTTEAHSIAFDPSNGNRILVGTEQAGIIVSTDGGSTWGVVLGSSAVPAVSSFSFDEVTGDVFASSYGRGIWSLNLAELVVFPPVITKAFSAPSTPLEGSVTLTFSVSNPNQTSSLTGVGFSDVLPAGLVETGSVTGTGCGAISVSGLPNSIIVSNATIAASGTCTITATVIGIAAGIMNNTTGDVTSTNGGTGNSASATILVIAPPTITKVFGTASLIVGGTTSLSFTVTNPNAFASLTGVSFTDTLPEGLAVSTPNGLTGACGGTITATPGSGAVSLAGATLAAGASCTFSVSVTAVDDGVQLNSVTAGSANGGSGAAGTASITTFRVPTISKAFGSGQIFATQSTSLTLTLFSPNTHLTLTGLAFSDTLPTGLLVSTPNGESTNCSGTVTAVAGSNSISLTGATLSPGQTCTVSVNVTGIVAGTWVNTTSTLTSTQATPGTPATASIVVFLTLDSPFQVSYAADPSAGESYINIVNTGANGDPLQGPGFGAAAGNICVNVYAFAPDEQEISCCSCLLTPNSVANLGVNRDLTSTTLTGLVPSSVVVKLVATLAGSGGAGTSCSASAATEGTLVNGMVAYGTTPQPVGTAYSAVEHTFIPSTLSVGEYASITDRCASILGNGSGFGVCNSCKSGALGAGKQ
jgi:hypothetical protein